MAISYNNKRRFIYNVNKFYERLDTISHLERVVASEKFLKLKTELETLERKVESGVAKTGEVNRMIKKLQSYKHQKLTELIDVYSPSLDKVVPYSRLFSGGSRKSIYDEVPQKEVENYNFEDREKIIERYKPRSSEPIQINLSDIKETDYVDYDETILNELYVWLNKQPKGFSRDILSILNRLISTYGFEEVARMVDTFQDNLPDLNAKVYYEEHLKPLYQFLIWLDGFLLAKQQELSMDENKSISNKIEKEENFNV